MNAGYLGQAVRDRIDSLSYLPTTVAVAMKFMQLGKDPEAEPEDYAKVISSDSSLCSKLLSLANSSWFGVCNRVTKPKIAVNLLGLGTVRTLAISYCLTGLHNELKLSPEESKVFWLASLCRAVAGKHFVAQQDPKLAEDAFTACLFQDLAAPVMYSLAREKMQPLMQDSSRSWKARLEAERQLFGLDHAEIGRMLAQKLELPDLFIDAIAFHHNMASLERFSGQKLLADAVHLASLFPQTLDAWNRADATELQAWLESHRPQMGSDPCGFLHVVQEEFHKLCSYFDESTGPELNLPDLLIQATREIADNTTRLVGTMTELLNQTAQAGQQVEQLRKEQKKLQDKTQRDPLTGALNREGFSTLASDVLRTISRYRSSAALLFLDLDRFKALNDTQGHSAGDQALVAVVNAITSTIRASDLVGRMGGDEFAVLLSDYSMSEAARVGNQILEGVAAQQLGAEQDTGVTVSVGLLWLAGDLSNHSLVSLLQAADRLMYNAKKSGGNRVSLGTIQSLRIAAS